MKRISVVACVAVFVAVAGCGPAGPSLVPVKGKVTLDGKPLAQKSLSFIPSGDSAGIQFGATTKADGTYELIASIPGGTKDELGAPAGNYKVTVNEPAFSMSADVKVQGQSAEADVAVSLPAPGTDKPAGQGIPAKYQSEATTTLTATVPEAGGEVNLELTSK